MVSNQKYSSELLAIEDCFGKIKMGRDIAGNLKQIQRILTRTFKQDFELCINKNETGKLFVMSIFPDETVCTGMVDLIVADNAKSSEVLSLWENCNKWYIEIDSLLIYDDALNSNPKEITACLIHEIGHVIYSSTIPSRLHKVMSFELTKRKMVTRDLVKNKKYRLLFLPDVLNACSYKMYNYLGNREEYDADKFVVELGYKDSLNSFLNKILISNGNELMTRTDGNAEKDTEVMVKWSIENIDELKVRKTKLRKQINGMLLNTPSIYSKRMLTKIKTIFFGTEKTTIAGVRTDIMNESTFQMLFNEEFDTGYDLAKAGAERKVLKEFFNSSKKKYKKVDRADIDYIYIKCEDITSYDDKIYLLDIVYYQEELIDTCLEAIENGEQDKVQNSKQELIALKKQLGVLRKKILAYKVREPKYGLFIRYPEGYQG